MCRHLWFDLRWNLRSNKHNRAMLNTATQNNYNKDYVHSDGYDSDDSNKDMLIDNVCDT